mgnify:FL=1|jgi:hypothetical protein
MGRKALHFKEIEHLLSVGYEAKDIVKITNIPKGTVYRIVDKLREEAKLNFDQLMTKDYLYKYQMNLDNYSKTIIQCNEEIATINTKYDQLEGMVMVDLESCPTDKYLARSTYLANLINIRNNRTIEIQKLVAQRDKSSEMKARIFNSGPVVYRINQVFENRIPQPEMFNEQTAKPIEFVNNAIHQEDTITDIKGEMIDAVESESAATVSEEDLQVLREMENT